ncbi:dimethylallyl transferase [Niveomyces insectorum RCEF 264]|uniref:Dimethylallyl transferase n=1 Tax=Niveomyces insectorum RCEF 264 TaxID=1081102 RepID=A0A167W7G6_9HYPO|nr:dimethylallyl transferase [Niveomyces insectorum RCEF 264]
MASSLLSYIKLFIRKSTLTATYNEKDAPRRDGHRQLLDRDSLLWNDEIGSMLTEMLTTAGYSKKSTALHSDFFTSSVTPFLGFHPRGTVAPHVWKSFMTDDHTPVELSWCWSSSKDAPAVRYSVEPISRSASLRVDAANLTANVRLLGDCLPTAPNMDLHLHRHFRNSLTTHDSMGPDEKGVQKSDVPQSQCFIAFDLLEKNNVVKQYYLPGRRAKEESRSNWSIVKEAIQNLPGSANSLLSSFDVLVEFIESFPVASRPAVEILAIDCLEPTQSRLKIYVRSLETSFKSVMDMMTLGGRAPKSPDEEESLRELFIAVFGLNKDTYEDDQPLREKAHRTGGMLYYFELKSNSKLPKSKIYLPILTLVYPIRDAQGRSIAGPRWKFVEGQGIDKFLRGHEVSKAWRKYGSVYRIWSDFIPEVVLTKPEDVKAFYSDSSLHVKSASSNGGWLFHQLLGDCMGLINGDRWKRIRVRFSTYFVHRAITEISPRLETAAGQYVDQLGADGAGSIEIHAGNTARFPFMTTAEYVYGPLSESEKASLWSLGQRSLGLMGSVLSGGVYRFKIYEWLRPQTHQCLTQFERDWTLFNERIYQSRKANYPQEKQPPIVHAWDSVAASSTVHGFQHSGKLTAG